jgi:hypothetical protein
MADGKRQWFKKGDISFGNKLVDGGTGDHIKINKSGYQKSDGISLIAQQVGDKRYEPGFTPNELYLAGTTSAPNGWYGDLIKAHIDSKKHSLMKSITIEERFNESNNNIDDGKPYSKRDTLLRFNDSSSDYFQHDLQIAGKTPFQSGQNVREAFANKYADQSIRLDNFKESDFENQDPVIYGFEIIIDAISSPLLNGSIEDFLKLYPVVSELQARNIVYYDFKTQFVKLFKTKGRVILNSANRPNYTLMSDANTKNDLNVYANSDIQSNDDIKRGGKVAYLSHYLQKIEGLSKLVESNTPSENKYLTEYGKDIIKLHFFEDVTGTLSSLAHLYKMLYWSKANGKAMIPENLLRFNCDIIVSECRNFNRVRKAIDRTYSTSNSIQIIKDNVSRHIYSLKECQFYFDKMPHDDMIDMGNITPYGLYDVTFDYKYVTSKYEKWVADPVKFGTYVGYNNGAIWKIGNKGSREARTAETNAESGTTGNIIDTSVPRFYTKDTNTLKQNGVNTALILQDYTVVKDKISSLQTISSISIVESQMNKEAPSLIVSGDNADGDEESKKSSEKAKDAEPSSLDKFKENSKIVAKKAAKNVANFAIKEINQQITTRTALLNNTLNKVRNALGFGGLPTEPKNVYPKPYAPASFGIFFDVRNELFNFIGEDIASSLGGFNNILNPYKNPMKPTANPLSSIVQKYGKFPSVKNNTAYVGNTLKDIVKKFGKG